MARITTHRGAAKDTHNYYLPEYYDAGREFNGQWLGKGAERLGLSGEVDSKQFMQLLKNRHPITGDKLSQRDNANRRNGWDVMFSAPKSVSIAFGLNNDRDLVDALREATNETLEEMEQDVMRRVNTAPGQQHHEKTGNFVSAVWIHPDARGVDGQVPDVQLHTHAYISNHTFDESTNRWLAADISSLFRDAQTYYEAGFKSRLADRVETLGYSVERSKNNFEITGVSRELIEKFSKRSGQINAKIKDGYADELAAKLGISLADAKGMVGALTRNHKNKSYDFDVLQQHWQRQLTPEESHQLDLVQQSKSTPTKKAEPSITAKDAVDFALRHHFEKEAAVRERQLLATAIKYGIENNTVDDIRADLATRTDLIRQGKDETAILTTKERQQEELDILNFAKHGRGAVKPINAHYQIGTAWLSDEQKKAITGLLSSADQLQILRGVAGVGKSTLLKELVPVIKATDRNVSTLAPTQKATQNLVTDGFDAATLQSFLLNEKSHDQIKHGVIIVDEAGLVDSPSFRALTRIAGKQDARIIAVGDAKQHTPVGRGHPLKLLQDHAGIKPKEVTKIRRQGGEYRQAVSLLSRGEIAEGFQALKDLKFVHEIADDSRDIKLAEDYANATKKYDQKDLLVIAATHAERKKITQTIRDKLKSRRIIKGKDKEFTTYLPKQLSVAERRDPLNYQPGDMIAFHRKADGGFEPGDQFNITKVTKDKIFAGGSELPLDAAAGFNVFRPETSHYAAGDVIRLTRGRKEKEGSKRLNNGGLHTIKSIRGSVITLDNDEKLPSNFRFFDHGIAVTSHVSQGTTVKRAFVAASSLSFPASSPEQMYVSASRAKKRVDIYTDNIDGLEQAISRMRPKSLASDVKPETDPEAISRPRLGQRLTRIKDVAHAYATKQLRRFGEWLGPGKQMEPQLGR